LHEDIQSPRRAFRKSPSLDRAAIWPLESEYRDGLGRLRRVDPEVVSRLLTAIAGGTRQARLLPRSVVVRGADQHSVDLSTPTGGRLEWEISADRRIAAGTTTAAELILPRDLPQGLLRLRIAGQGLSEEATLVVCPQRAYQGADQRRMWGLAVQLYAIRSSRNWGHGDFTDLSALVDMAAEVGASAVGLNPLHALFDDRPMEPSPYFPSSRSFLNALYVDLDAVPEFPGAGQTGLAMGIANARNAATMDYAAVSEAKLRGLKLAYEQFVTRGSRERRAAFDGFRRSRGSLLAKFAAFELLRRKFNAPWWDWPIPWRRPDAAALDDLRKLEDHELTYVEFVQWLAHEQLDRCRARARERGLPIGLYLDVAVGVRRDGFDAWCDQDAIIPDVTMGAPPDLLNRAGQDWGLAAFNPIALEDCGFEPWRRALLASMQYAGAIRLDHVLGLKRLFLVPTGMTAASGLYVQAPFKTLLGLTVLSSSETECVVIGEDLGTVPEGFRETMSDWGLWSYQVMLFERFRNGNFVPPARYRKQAVATFSTHDLPTFAGWLHESDLSLRGNLGLAAGETALRRQEARRALRRVLGTAGEQINFASIAEFLAATPARLVMVSLEDLMEIRDQVNVPGTTDAYPNWRRRLPVPLEHFMGQRLVRQIATRMSAVGRSLVAPC
jgi:4-alpha-glucanotransferase